MTPRMAFPAALFCLTPLAASAENIAPMALNSLGMVPAKIQGAPVEDEHGAVVGRVAKIEADRTGRPLRADVTLNGGRMVFLETATLSYDENVNILVTALNEQQLAQLAGEPRG